MTFFLCAFALCTNRLKQMKFIIVWSPSAAALFFVNWCINNGSFAGWHAGSNVYSMLMVRWVRAHITIVPFHHSIGMYMNSMVKLKSNYILFNIISWANYMCVKCVSTQQQQMLTAADGTSYAFNLIHKLRTAVEIWSRLWFEKKFNEFCTDMSNVDAELATTMESIFTSRCEPIHLHNILFYSHLQQQQQQQRLIE